MKPRKLPDDDLWSQTPASLRAWASDWAEGKTRLAIREGGRCGFCGYTPEKQTEKIKGKRLRQLTKRELLLRHMRDHYYEGHQRGKWQHPTRFDHRGQIKPKEGKL